MKRLTASIPALTVPLAVMVGVWTVLTRNDLQALLLAAVALTSSLALVWSTRSNRQALIAARRAEAAARESENFLRTTAEVCFDSFAVYSAVRDNDGQIVDLRFEFVNDRVAEYFGYEASQLLENTLLVMCPTPLAYKQFERLREVFETGVPYEAEYVSQLPDSHGQWIRIHAERSGEMLAVSGRDVHERRVAEASRMESEKKLSACLESIEVGVMLVGRDGLVLQANPAADRILEQRTMAIDVQTAASAFETTLGHGHSLPESEWPIARALRGETVRGVDLHLRWPDGHERWVRTSALPMWRESETTPYATVCSFMDVTLEIEQRRELDARVLETAETNIEIEAQRFALTKANERLAHLATTDGLTGLANHRTFQERLELDWEQARVHGLPLSIALIDVDHFKGFNDEHGHQAGDGVLRDVARELKGAADPRYLVARYGGEEFVVVMSGADQAAAMAAAERIRRAIAQRSWVLRPISVSVGVATLTPTMDREALIEAADAALYRSKHGGRNRVMHDGDPTDRAAA